MLLFLDTADIAEIERFAFLIHGVTTTPTIIKRSGLSTEDFMQKVRKSFPDLEIHVEALEKDAIATEKLIAQFTKKKWYDADKIVFKVPISEEGLKATESIRKSNPSVRINLHMAFSPAQASLAMLVKPAYIAPLIGRYADKVAELTTHGKRAKGSDAGYDMLEGIIQCKRAMQSDAIILASSSRTVHDFALASMLGSDAATLPPHVLKEALQHPMTEEGVNIFWEDLAQES
jgi:transaldolase